jgi:hypothetical protein
MTLQITVMAFQIFTGVVNLSEHLQQINQNYADRVFFIFVHVGNVLTMGSGNF